MQPFLMTLEPTSLLLGLLVGAVIFGTIVYGMQMRQCERTRQHVIESVQQRFHELHQQYADAQQRVAALESEIRQYAERLQHAHGTTVQLQTLLEKEREDSDAKLALLQQAKEQMTLEFKTLSQQISETQSQKFVLQNSEQLQSIVRPFKEQMEQFQKQMHQTYNDEAKGRSLLQQELYHLKELNQTLSQEAHGLTKALKGESKQQGIWGEMILEKVLEASGLRRGHEYEREVLCHSSLDATHYRPDVVVYLPYEREVIVDAKTSLRAYERYVNAEDAEKPRYIKQHVEAIHLHVKELSQKDYTKLKGIHTVDFVLMFVPIESALVAAMEHDASLYERAYKKNILLVTPSTLMIALRAIENSWRYDRSQKNAQEIAQRAGILYDKFVGFVHDMQKIADQLELVQKSYTNAYGKLHEGRGSLTSQLHKLKNLGASASKRLPPDILKKIEEQE